MHSKHNRSVSASNLPGMNGPRPGSPLRRKSPSPMRTQITNRTHVGSFKIVQDFNITELREQEKDIEIERLQATCAALNQRGFGAEVTASHVEAL